MKICVDPGHGGVDPGAVGLEPFRFEEKDFNLRLGLALEEELESRNHWIVMTRRRDRSLTLEARANFSNRLAADMFISVHANAAETSTAEGMEVFHFPDSASGRNAATHVLDSMKAKFPDHTKRGVKEANFAVLRLTAMPAILVEAEFITNPAQLEFLANEENQRGLAVAIADGIDAIA